jgi:hypothetical protein
MKRFLMVAVLVMALTALLATTALAGPPAPGAQGFSMGRGNQAQDGTCGTCTMDGAGAGQMRRGGMPAWAGQPDEVATLLKMTAEEIQAARQAGKSLAQIATDKGITTDELVSTILDAKKVQLAALVTDGKLSQTQADLMIERMTEQVTSMVERTTTGPAADRGQGMGRGQSRGQDDDVRGQGMMGRGQGMRGRGNR